MKIINSNYKFTPSLLRKRYATALGLIALLIIISQVLIQVALDENTDSARVINIAGRQRMLSQKITKSALALSNNSDNFIKAKYIIELTNTLELWRTSDKALKEGSVLLGIEANNSPIVIQMFSEIKDPYNIIIINTNLIIESYHNNDTNINEFLTNILEQESIFLQGMNDIVFQYDFEATNKLKKIKQLEIILLLITFCLLLFEALFIFVPVEKEMKKTFQEIKDNEHYLDMLASYDEMTGLYNKRVGILLLSKEFEKSKRTNDPLTISFIDADGLKHINDKLGHKIGDEYIKSIAQAIKSGLRHSEAAFRYGGDEFVLIINGDISVAKLILERISENVTSINNGQIKHSISFGYAQLKDHNILNAEDLIKIADIDMYKNKNKKKQNGL
ncbi:MAG: diguanylate cyclase [Spirochaetaceae bacterium]